MAINPVTGQEEVLGYDPTQVGIPGVNMATPQVVPPPTPQVATAGTTPQNPPMMTPPQPVQQVAQPVVTPPQPTTKAVEQKPIEVPTSIDEWKKQGSNIGTLEQMIEKTYGTVATNKNGVLQANIGGVDYQWNIDQAGNPIKTKVGGEDPQLIFNQLMAGKKFDNTGIQTTPEYYKAKARYDIASQYMGMGEEQLYNAYLNGDISPELEKDLIGNPYLAIAKDKVNKKTLTDSINKESVVMLNAYNKANNNKYTPVTVQKTPLEILSDKFMSSFESMGKGENEIKSFKDYMQTNYPNIVTDSLKLNAKTQELQKLTDQRDARLDEIIKENPGISINRATMLASRQNKDINAQIQSMGYEIQNLSANLKYQTELADKNYSYDLAEQQRKDAIEKEKRTYLYQQIEKQQELEASQAQAEAKQKQQDFENTLKLQELQTKLGDRKTTVIKDDATGEQKLIDSTTGETIQSFKTGLKPETMTPYQTAQIELDKQKQALEQKKFDVLNGVVTGATTGGKVPDITVNAQISTDKRDRKNLQCGEFVNDLASKYGVSAKLGDSYKSKINALNKIGLSNSPQPGSIFVLNTGTSTGHTGIVQSVNPDGSFTVQEANKSGSKQGEEPTLGTYKSTVGMTFSRPVILNKGENTNAEITTYNSATPTQQAKLKNNASYNDFIDKKQEIMANPDALMQDVMRYSQGGKDMDSETAKSLGKFGQALGQVESLQANIKKISTGPLIGRLKEFNPYSSEGQALKAEINSLIPNLARGVYGEVGVLTDNDILNYAKTVPNLKSTNDVNNLVLAMTLKTMMNGYKNILQTQASAGRDVSGFQGQYKRYEDKINTLLGGQDKTGATQLTPAIQNIKKTYLNY